MQNISSKKKPRKKSGYYIIKHELLWSVGLPLLGGFFAAGVYTGNTKFDKILIELSENKKKLEDTIKACEEKIQYMQHNSDSASLILSHMPYDQMTLDTIVL